MGAVPKNKITKSEQAKRRRGNSPQLKKDPKQASIPKHKRGLVAQFKKFMGLN